MTLILIAAAVIAASNVVGEVEIKSDQPKDCGIESRQNPATLAYLHSLPASSKPTADETSSGYVRIVANYSRCTISLSPFARSYEDEKRDIIHRFFMHKLVSKSLNVKIAVRPLGVSATKTLIQIGRDSGKQGETWATDVGNSLNIMPYFRVEPNTTVQLNAAYLSNRTYASSIASDTLDILNRATALITPTTPLITASNKVRFNDASTFLDSTINGLLKVEMRETLRMDAQLRGKNQTLASLVLYTTGANDPYNRNDREAPRPVGRWDIETEHFAGSLFSGIDDKSATPSVASVMNFQVIDGKRVRDLLGGDATIVNARDAVLKAKDGATKESSGALCRLVASRADAEGFSAFDVSWVVAAYIYDMAPSAGESSALRTGCGQAANLKAVFDQEAAGPAH